jgi:hemerythrin-like domain-containing protein
MEKATHILSEEQKKRLKITDSLIKECDVIKNENTVNRPFFSQTVEFIKNYADKYHHAKEEDILFPSLCGGGVEMHCNPTEQMLYEHNLGREYVKGIEAGLKEDDKTKIIENSLKYAGLLKDHIYKEDNILYPMADEALSEKQQAEILKKFQLAEKKFDAKVVEKYLDFVKNL